MRSAAVQVNKRREGKINDTNLDCALAGFSFSPRHWTGVPEKHVEDEVYACRTAWGTVGEHPHGERKALLEFCNVFQVGEVTSRFIWMRLAEEGPAEMEWVDRAMMP